ncbi:uncharacterized protein IL334_003104 [Kwoniella shivajii]|uniref:Uncharacterized protein n=1 Tax=Kwoniella shivajii TaxID=564305 RepID=A0ABZ1CWZ1_9TREE|nr:hypothetical protein IL334_003104 [Kwoniella shivajii]
MYSKAISRSIVSARSAIKPAQLTQVRFYADKPNETSSTVKEAAKAFKSDGSIGSKFNSDGSVGGKAQEVGGPFAADGAVGKQFTDKGAIGGLGQKVAENVEDAAKEEEKKV